jgi:mono/diheme cytochrome c family protein
MIPAHMTRRPLVLAAMVLAAVALVACGSQGISHEVASDSPSIAHGGELFATHCSDCHTLDVVGTQGSATKVRNEEHTDGPNFNVRKEDLGAVLYAIRNGGFSGAIMPQNIVVGADADKVAAFVAKYAGQDVVSSPGPASTTTTASP